jgi:hypothetical protein
MNGEKLFSAKVVLYGDVLEGEVSMFDKLATTFAVAGLLVSSLPLQAHHSFAAEYDADKPIKIQGKVTKVEFINPHSWINVDVTNPDGKVINYACEAPPPNGLYRLGWTRNSVKVGDEIIVEGSLSKNGRPTMNVKVVTTAEGKRLLAGSPDDAAPNSKPAETK